MSRPDSSLVHAASGTPGSGDLPGPLPLREKHSAGRRASAYGSVSTRRAACPSSLKSAHPWVRVLGFDVKAPRFRANVGAGRRGRVRPRAKHGSARERVTERVGEAIAVHCSRAAENGPSCGGVYRQVNENRRERRRRRIRRVGVKPSYGRRRLAHRGHASFVYLQGRGHHGARFNQDYCQHG